MTETVVPDRSVNAAWGLSLSVSYCAHCHSAYLMPDDVVLTVCPTCLQTTLESQPEQMRRQLPELAIPFEMGTDRVQGSLAEWCKGIWFRAAELQASLLSSRLRRCFLPLWLVDSDVNAVWQAEMGFNYQAASFREHYRGGEWVSQEITETRIRWDPRVGTLARHYDNVAVPALTRHEQWMARLGGYDLRTRKPYSARLIADSVVRIPDYGPDTAWTDAESALNRSAANECQLASGADHARQWSMQAQFADRNWTQMLVPAYVTHYQEGESTYPVWINGQNGHIYGFKMMSMKKAIIVSLVVGILAVLCFLLGLVLTLVGVGIVLVLLSLPLGLLAFAPVIWVWTRNRQIRRQMAAF
jgi:hypothetical protein